jgi:hypothetical protein
LTTLVGVHDFWLAVLHDGFFQGIHTGVGRQASTRRVAQSSTALR